MITLSKENILAGSNNGGWNKRQLELLGVAWPPVHGWLRDRIGQSIPDDTYAQFMALKGIRKRGKRSEISTPDLLDVGVTTRNAQETASNAPPVTRDQAARDYANSAWESDAANFDAVPERAVKEQG